MVYVLSDIHGNERRFNSIMKQINLQHEDTLYVLGDVIDRHPGGIRLLRRIMAMPNAKMLLGNHEFMMLRALGCPYDPCDPTSDLIREDATDLLYPDKAGKYSAIVKEIERRALGVGLKLLRAKVRHLGTEKSHILYAS